jgi:ubiquinone/menaquinone biosynthesis C-methylase UbiE
MRGFLAAQPPLTRPSGTLSPLPRGEGSKTGPIASSASFTYLPCMLSPLERAAYAARQASRVAWFMGHYFATSRFRRAPPPEGDVRRLKPRAPGPGLERILADIAALFERDLDNVERGLYPLPRDHDGSLAKRLKTSRAFFADVPLSAERRAERRGNEVRDEVPRGSLPAYFVQNFHYQTGGYLTRDSAQLYDTQVEVLFSGTANAMRRQCLPPIAAWLKGRDQRQMRLLDIACGTGRLLRFVKQAFPRIMASGLDLSAAYLEEAQQHLAPYRDVGLITGNAEHLPYADRSVDILTCVYLFHEVPPKVRRIIAGEFARVLKPGGRLVFMDSLQRGDRADFDGLLESFPLHFHEPYYPSYLREDLASLFGETGLVTAHAEPVFLSKLMVLDSPGA